MAGEFSDRSVTSYSLTVEASDGKGNEATVMVEVEVTYPCGDGTLVPNPASNPGLVSDCEVMLAIRDELRGTVELNWGPGVPMRSWDGLQIIAVPGGSGVEDRAAVLFLRYKGLNGRIPAGLSRLTRLGAIYLNGNSFSGGIPPELGSLPHLGRLEVSSSGLSGAIPPELGNISGLLSLDLDNNDLTGSLPAELGNLGLLEILRLTNNSLTGSIPASWQNMRSLQRLTLSGNRITGCTPIDPGGLEYTDLNDLNLPACPNPLTLSLSGPSEAVEEGQRALYTVSVEGERRTAPILVNYAVTAATAAAGEDYPSEAATGTVTIPAGDDIGNFRVTITDDESSELAETFTVAISGPTGGGFGAQLSLGTASVETTISESDPITLNLAGPSEVGEGERATYIVMANGGRPSAELTVNYTVTAGTATAGADYSGDASGSATIPAGGESATFTVDVTDDELFENVETFTVAISDPVGGGGPAPSLGVESVETTIALSDPVTLAFAGPVQVDEGSAATYYVSVIGAAPTVSATMQYTVTAGTATAGSDYPSEDATGSVSIPADGDQRTFAIAIADDNLSEGAETFTVTVSGSLDSGQFLGELSTVTTIAPSDPITVTLTGPTGVEEGDTATYAVALTGGVSTEDVTVSYRVADHTATAGEDYPANTGGTLSIPAGTTSATIAVAITDDDLSETAENFFVNVSEVLGGGGPTPVLGSTAVATGIAASDPLTVDLSGPSEVVEGETATYTVTSSGGRPSAALTVRYTVTGDAVTGENPSAVRTGSVIIPARRNSATFDVDTTDDGVVDLDEAFTVAIDSVAGGGGPMPSIGSSSVETTFANRSPAFDEDSYRFSVDETAAVGDPVGTVGAVDADGDPVAYAIASGNDDGTLTLDADTGPIAVAGELDFREAGSHTLTVEARDGLGGTTTVTVNVTVTTVCTNGTAVPDPANNPGLVDDCRALLAARDALRGTATLGWSASSYIDEWQGVELGGTPQRVTKIFLRLATGLTGSLPAALGKLSGLQSLTLDNNRLTGAIPAELGNLNNLEALHLQGNQLSGAIPTDLGNLSSLEALNLEGNRLTGDVPASLGKLSNLQSLNLGDNRLTGAVPTELGNLSNLQQLRLSGNGGMSGTLPTELGSLSALRDLRLRGIGLTGVIPASLGNLSNLGLLDMANNQLTGALPPTLSNLVNMHSLFLNSNQMSGSIPSSWRDMTSLRYLYLERGNRITGCNPMRMDLLAGTDLGDRGLSPCPVFNLSLSGPSEASEGETATYTVTVAGDTHAAAITVSYAVTAGTATAGEDYSEADATGTVTIPVGATTSTFAIAITDDDLAEEAETLTVTVSGPTGGGNGAILSITTTSVETTIPASGSTS